MLRPQPGAMPWRVRDWLLVASDDQCCVSVRHILRVVCRHFGFTAAQLTSLQRDPHITLARHIWWYLATRLSGQSLPQIGRAAGGRDHTSILYARDKIAARRAVDAGLDRALIALEVAVKSEPERI